MGQHVLYGHITTNRGRTDYRAVIEINQQDDSWRAVMQISRVQGEHGRPIGTPDTVSFDKLFESEKAALGYAASAAALHYWTH